MNATNNEWGQFIDLEKGIYIPDKNTGLVNNFYANRNIVDKNNTCYVQRKFNYGDLPFPRQCLIYLIYGVSFIYDSFISKT